MRYIYDTDFVERSYVDYMVFISYIDYIKNNIL